MCWTQLYWKLRCWFIDMWGPLKQINKGVGSHADYLILEVCNRALYKAGYSHCSIMCHAMLLAFCDPNKSHYFFILNTNHKNKQNKKGDKQRDTMLRTWSGYFTWDLLDATVGKLRDQLGFFDWGVCVSQSQLAICVNAPAPDLPRDSKSQAMFCPSSDVTDVVASKGLQLRRQRHTGNMGFMLG